MKTKFILTTLLTLLLCFYSGCRNKTDVGISQLRTDILFASKDGYDVTVYLEEREIPLSLDGYSAQRTPVLIFKICSLSAISGTFTIFTEIDGKQYSASPIERADKNLRAEIPVETLPKEEINITLKGEKELQLTATSIIPQGVAPYTKALETAKSALGDKITYTNNVPNGDFMVRVLIENNTAFWYVGYATQNHTYSYLINSDGTKIIATRTAETINY